MYMSCLHALTLPGNPLDDEGILGGYTTSILRLKVGVATKDVT